MSSRPSQREYNSRRLTDINRALTYARSLADLLDLTVDCAMELLQANCAVLMLTADDGLLHIRASRGVEAAAVERFREPLDENLLVRLTGLFGPRAREHFLGVPLVVQGSVIGLLAVRLQDGHTPDEEAEWLLSSLADQASVALQSTHNDDVRHLLEERLDELQRDQEGKDRAIQILSHDLRTPLTAMLGYTALLSSEVLGPLNERQQTTLHRIKSVADHMESILANVLEMARLSGGRFRVAFEPVELNSLVAEAFDIVRSAAARANVELQIERAPALTVKSDASRLRLVLIQLLDNAIKYSPEGFPVIVRLRSVERQGRTWAKIEVVDRGPGIEKDFQDEIFQPYVRRDGLSERAKAGVGLGLAIAHGVVERIGGELTVHSSLGLGACFRILLPA